MNITYDEAYAALFAWCAARKFSGPDPFDGLNSRVFQASPLTKSRLARLFWTQFFKRSPVDCRALVRVPPDRNPKGIALFALAALADYRRLQTKAAEMQARGLLGDLVSARLKGFSGAAWGYNFDWQARSFFLPRGTPAIVPTAFAARALFEAAQVFGETGYLPVLRSACDFILKDLNRSNETTVEVCFSYSPLDQTRVLNASLLAGEVLASVGSLTGEKDLCEWGIRSARFVASRQRVDGSWPYGVADYQSWVDNFHTAFVLLSLSRITAACDAWGEFEVVLRRGYEFWCDHFFSDNGWPNYYPDRPYPADSHSVGAAVVTLTELARLYPQSIDLAKNITQWSIENLRSPEGFFYYQRRRFYTVNIPYLRWSQAWMAYGLAKLIENTRKSTTTE